jgi:hypothetical protein
MDPKALSQLAFCQAVVSAEFEDMPSCHRFTMVKEAGSGALKSLGRKETDPV